MTISIIIPVYNVEKHLDTCLESLFNQGLDDSEFEIILIDDGSTDSSPLIANKWAGKHNNILFLSQENQGQAIARNVGLSLATGRYIQFVDSDDYLLPNKLSTLLQIADENNIDALVYSFLVQQKDGSVKPFSIPNVKYNSIFSGEEILLNYFIFGSICRGIFRRSVFENNKLLFRKGIAHEDVELCFRLFPNLDRIMFIDDNVYFYRYNIQSTDRSTERSKLLKNIESEAILASLIIKDIDQGKYSTEIQQRYHQIINSIMVGFFIRLKNSKIWSPFEYDTKVDWLRSLGVYPIKGRTSSWKSYLLAKFLNSKYLLKLYLFRL